MILITGAAGKTGLAVLKALLRRRLMVRVLVRSNEQAEYLLKNGAADAVIGDLTDSKCYRKTMAGISSLYHICPNMHPKEFEIGQIVIDAALHYELSHFVYHSVLHPQAERMPHHWQKMRVEEKLFESGLGFTILQPAPYMQNILAGKSLIANEKLYRVPYPVKTAISMVDLADLADAAAAVLSEPVHQGAVYEIVGTEALSQDTVAEEIGKVIGQEIAAEEIDIRQWRKQAEKSGLGAYQIDALIKMFSYYACFGLTGNNNLLRWLLGREPNSLAVFAEREFAGL